MKQTMTLFSLTTALALLLGGCASVSTSGFEVSVKEGAAATAFVKTDDRVLSHILRVESGKVRREPSGFASAQIRVRNTRREDVGIQYKYKFFDGDGMEVQPNVRAWEQTIIHGGETVTLSAVAPEKGVSKFAVRVRNTF